MVFFLDIFVFIFILFSASLPPFSIKVIIIPLVLLLHTNIIIRVIAEIRTIAPIIPKINAYGLFLSELGH